VKRIESNITHDEEEIRYKIEKLGETFSVKVILKNSINEMETYAKSTIYDWQKQNNSTNQNVDSLRTKFKSKLEDEIKKVKNEFVNKLKKLKKNDDQISNFVYDLFKQLRTRLHSNDTVAACIN
jgi:signal recognition particle GTPase